MKKPPIFHTFLFAIFSLLFFYSLNAKHVSLDVIYIPITIIILSLLTMWILLNFIIKNREKTGLIISLFLLIFFSYGHFYKLVQDFLGREAVVEAYIIYMVVCGIFFSFSVYRIIKTHRNLHYLTNIFNIVASLLILICVTNIITVEVKKNIFIQQNKRIEDTEAYTIDLESLTEFPDIYYIILDAYITSSSLKEFFNFDNHKFIDYLMEKGFYIASASQSNYQSSKLSLASSLNMEYVNDYWSGKRKRGFEEHFVFKELIFNSKVQRFLKKRGYKTIYFGSRYQLTKYNKYADMNFQYGLFDEFQTCFLRSTILYPFSKDIINQDFRRSILYTFDKLKNIPTVKGPKFILAHIPCPHRPYIFGPKGEKITAIRQVKMQIDKKSELDLYLGQLIFVNKKVEELIEDILSKSDASPIIIIQADHGILLKDLPLSDEQRFKLLFRIFNAYYLPDNGEDLLYNSITPVNTFRLVFNCYFHENYDLLNDASYFLDLEKSTKLINITEKLK